jgi:hypothetical protein
MPSSLLTNADRVSGSTAAVLMHHSHTARGKPGNSSSGVGPATVMTSCMTVAPEMGSVIWAFGSRIAMRLWPVPPAPA